MLQAHIWENMISYLNFTVNNSNIFYLDDDNSEITKRMVSPEQNRRKSY